MKISILTLFITFIACAYAAAVSLPEDLERDVIEAIEKRDIESLEHPDGREELRVYEEGTYLGSVIIGVNGDCSSP